MPALSAGARHFFSAPVPRVGQTGQSSSGARRHLTRSGARRPTPTSSPASSASAERLDGNGDGGFLGGGWGSGSQNRGGGGRGGGNAGRSSVGAVDGGGGGGGGHSSGCGAGSGLLQALMCPAVAVTAMSTLSNCAAAWILGVHFKRGMTGGAGASKHGSHVEEAASSKHGKGKSIGKTASKHGTSIGKAAANDFGLHVEEAASKHGKSIEKAASKHGAQVKAGLCWAACIGGGAYAITHLLVELLARRGGKGDGAAGVRAVP
ncbi:hypothetical protein HXX76_011433 [Chlamydomonas incerta]|uniref:Uncharacterized protein n=1 Tax=Chlamydomonas incerta TaxID=51695 RepID=A0A835SXQ0_CHLIN|nr:hypothetical protein HXX76_011433 [Chlamydomonas incerta]|eukprot:KAG2428730.1 hypothetical protein HXX76_011433 [Chlamydomonas incerta]